MTSSTRLLPTSSPATHPVEIPDIGAGPLDGRIDRYVTARLELYETIALIARFARSRAPISPRSPSTSGSCAGGSWGRWGATSEASW